MNESRGGRRPAAGRARIREESGYGNPAGRVPRCYPARVRRRQCRARRCGSGGIGRRGGLKSRCPRGLGGSSPPSRTNSTPAVGARNQAGRSRAPERGHHHPMEARQRSSCACVRPTQHRPVRKTRRGEGRTLPVRPARRRRSRAPFAQGSDFPSERGQSVQATLSMSRARPSQAAARRTSSSSSGVGEARSSARLAVKYSGRKPALSSAFM